MSRTLIQLSLIAGALAAVSVPRLALADEAAPPHFGDAGQFALHLNDAVASGEGDLIAGPQIQGDYFVAPHLSLGLMVGANYYSTSAVDTGATHQLIFRVGPRIGYDIPLSDYVSFWPQIGVDYRNIHETEASYVGASPASTTGSTSSTQSSFGFTAVAPILIHPTKGFFIGAGPSFYTEFSNSSSSGGTSVDNSKVTAIGLMATIGGAF